jgi:DNA helicase II / ATP-dependent DNA helicase PcrA
MIQLNDEQQAAVSYDGNVVVTACPGSGKTRVLTARAIRGVRELKSPKERVVALTFTNRAADEIESRLNEENVPTERLWAGTIHAFALEWVLRPYAPYLEETRLGFTVADEYLTGKLLDDCKNQLGINLYTEISTWISRDGLVTNSDERCNEAFNRYKAALRAKKLIDYDDVLYLAFKALIERPEIAATLASIIRLVCVDEVQDIQDLQYGILSAICKASASPPSLFFVGDPHQSIYESLGALTKTAEEIAAEFGLDAIKHLRLEGNYRSTQRLIDFYRQFRPGIQAIKSRAKIASNWGLITFTDQTVAKERLAFAIADYISSAIQDGIAPDEICVLAPQWRHVRAIAQQLTQALPHIAFDAPGLSPLYSARDNVWFEISRLFLTSPAPSRIRARMMWARGVLTTLETFPTVSLRPEVGTARRLLRVINSIVSTETEGILYLQTVFAQLLVFMGIELDSCDALKNALEIFFEKAAKSISDAEGAISSDVESFRRFFNHPSGVVVSTCHGVKGEEYDTVIAFGLLRGYVPNWDVIVNGSSFAADEQEAKLTFVICSRAKRRLHLISEAGHKTRKGRPYETAWLLQKVQCNYDL